MKEEEEEEYDYANAKMDPLEGYEIVLSDVWGLVLSKDDLFYYYSIYESRLLFEGVASIMINTQEAIKHHFIVN